MTRLLVSVRSAEEAEQALAGGAALIDVKEPDRGPLGAAAASVIAAVVQRVGGRAPVSAALGELHEGNALQASLARRVAFAKFGLAGCGDDLRWKDRWRAEVRLLPEGVAPVGVVYADWSAARAPDPREVLAAAAELGCGALLVDTYDKSAGSVANLWSHQQLRWLVTEARAAGMRSVVAGSLCLDDLKALAWLEPDYFGVRRAACSGGRSGRLSAARVDELVDAIGGGRIDGRTIERSSEGIAHTLPD